MDLVSEIQKFIDGVSPRLNERFENREKILLMARELIRLSGETISLSHRKDRDKALKKYQEALEKSKQILAVISNFPELLYGDVGTAFQELSEATVILSLYFGERLLTSYDLNIPETYYIMGIADAIGEMRRKILEDLRNGKLDEAEKTYSIMEDLYNILWTLEYPKALVPGLRQKIDALRRLLEETYHDLFLAKISLKT
ncbi:MAG: haloacid dehalogenase [Sulfolobaceae archaeon]|nr:haloacid dehalogenase [Sulfolobaceae archaeon]